MAINLEKTGVGVEVNQTAEEKMEYWKNVAEMTRRWRALFKSHGCEITDEEVDALTADEVQERAWMEVQIGIQIDYMDGIDSDMRAWAEQITEQMLSRGQKELPSWLW